MRTLKNFCTEPATSIPPHLAGIEAASRQRQDRLLVAVVACFALIPLWAFKYTPATDLPQHVAISSVLFRLFSGDVDVARFYALNWQPVPYHLAYLLMAPCVGFFGPFIGAKLVLTLIGGACTWALTLCAEALAKSSVLGLGGLVLFYGAWFFWGFIPTLVGMPFVLLCLGGMLRFETARRPADAWMASLCGALACTSHVALLPACLAACASFGLLEPRRNLPATLGVGLWCILPAMPMLWAHLQHRSGSGLWQALDFETPVSAFNHVRQYLGPLGRGPGRALHQLLVVGLLVAAVGARRHGRMDRRARLVVIFALLNAGLVLAVPLAIGQPVATAWLLNVRYLTFAEAGLILLCPQPTTQRGLTVWRRVSVLWISLFVLSMLPTWRAYNAYARPLDILLAASRPAHATLIAPPVWQPFGRTWPALTANLYCYFLPTGIAFEENIFTGGHLPIRVKQRPAPGNILQRTSRSSEPLDFGGFDLALLMDKDAEAVAGESLRDGRVVRTSGPWALYYRVPTSPTMP